MKFTNAWVVLYALSISLLNSCTSFSPDVESKNNASENAPVLLTPMQSKAKVFNTLPNLYKIKASEHKSSTQTLSQFKAALALKQQGKFTQARERFMAMSEQHPDLSGIWLQLALLIKEQVKEQVKEQGENDIEQKHKDMSIYLNNAISANPLSYLAHNELAQVLRKQGEFQQALNHYELAIKSWPAFAQGYLNRGILYDLYMGQKSLALADYEFYQALSHDDSRQIKGWIIDLQRQIKSAQKGTQTGAML